MNVRAAQVILGAVLIALVASGCSGAKHDAKTITLYTCATDTVEQAVIKAYEDKHSGTKVDVFRAPTGKLNARVAADVRSGGIKADVIWACDPLTMHQYDKQGLLKDWSATGAGAIPAKYRTRRYVGVDLLYLIAVVHKGTSPPATWADLTKPTYRSAVAVPSPTFAASALGMLGYFAGAPAYGIDYYTRLKSNGAKQLDSPDDVLTGVAQGTYRAGFALANAAYSARKKGSPVEVVWPKPGAIAIYAPIGITTRKGGSTRAAAFASFVASREGQTIMAKAGAYTTLPGLPGPPIPAGSPIVSPDWPTLFGDSTTLLSRYAKVFGG
ncbi:MAG: extracellular solute-binding protein [Mycobacteriales bacterium]